MEESRTAMTLKVLDVNDPKTILVDPPKPEWMIKQEEAKAAEAKNGKKKKRRGGKDGANEKPKKKTDETKTDKDEGANSASQNEASSVDGGHK